MSDIEDELLALAGGDSEDEGSRGSSREASASPPKRTGSKKAPAKKTKRKGRYDDSDDDEEEGEASSAPGTPNSLESAPMDESDSDAEPSRPRGAAPPADDVDAKYPVDGMYMSEAEKREVMNMREVERELVIAERISEIDRQRQNRLLRQMVTKAEDEESQTVKKKRSADTAELEDGYRKSSKQRTGKASETAMDSLRRARAEKQRRKEDHDRRRDAYSPRGKDYSEDESDGGYGRRQSPSPSPEPEREAPPAELRDFERVRLGRNEFAQVCVTPGFEQGIAGCFIRIALGPHPETGIEQYRMAVIKGFTTGRPYALNGPSGTFVTDLYARAAHGKAIKEFPFIAASSGKFTENELHRYQVTCQNDGLSLPTKDTLSGKIDDINNLINHSWTRDEIKASVAKKQELRRRFDPQERARVSRLLEEARENGENEKVKKLQEDFDKLSTQRLAFKTSLGPSKLTDSPRMATEQEKLAERNKENRRMNVEAVRKAQLKEKARFRQIDKAIKRGEHVEDDPSRRLRTKAKFVHDINESHDDKPSANDSGSATPTNGTPKAATSNKQGGLPHLAKLQGEKNLENKGLPTIHKPLVDDDVIGALDLDIDVEI